MNESILWVAIGVAVGLPILLLLIMLPILRAWLRAFLGGCPVSLLQLLGAALRGNSPALLIEALLSLRFREVDTTLSEVESVYIAHKVRSPSAAELVDLVRDFQTQPERSL